MNNLYKNASILSLGTFSSKVIGIIYIIPFYIIIGGEKNAALFQYGYVPYTIFLSIGTAGIPLAVSKYISHYNSLQQYENSKRLLKVSIFLMLATGVISFLLMYFLAPLFGSLQETKGQITKDEITTVIRATSFALLIIPIMSLFRGYFQGNGLMLPSSLSQIIEQIARVIFLLCGTYLALHILKTPIDIGISVATFSAFIGALASLIYLLYQFKAKKNQWRPHTFPNHKYEKVPYKILIKTLTLSAIPFIFVGIGFSLYQQIDLYSLPKLLISTGYSPKVAVDILSIINFSVQKLVLIPGAFSLSLSMSAMPLFTAYYAKKNLVEINNYFTDIIAKYFLIILPLCLFMSLLSYPMYYFFFGVNEKGSEILSIYIIMSVFISFFSVTTAILQGLNNQKHTVIGLLLGIFVKIGLQYPLVALFAESGAVLSTGIGYILSNLYILYVINKTIPIDKLQCKKKLLLILLINLIFVFIVGVLYYLFLFIVPITGRISSFVILSFVGLTSFALYGIICKKVNLLKKI